MSKVEEAVQCFENGFNCCQAIFSTYCEDYGLDKATALKIASSFDAGKGPLTGTCGAITGAYMLIGLAHGMYKEEDTASKEKTLSLVQEFTDQFDYMHGSIRCKDLLKCDLSTKEGLDYAKTNELYNKLCTIYIRDAAQLLEDFLEQNKQISVYAKLELDL